MRNLKFTPRSQAVVIALGLVFDLIQPAGVNAQSAAATDAGIPKRPEGLEFPTLNHERALLVPVTG